VVSLKTEVRKEIPDYEKYDYSSVWKGRAMEDRVEKAIVSRWASGQTGIELGGGFGRITQVLEKRIDQMFMLDYSLRNLRRASTRLQKTTLIRGTLDKLPFEDSVFDFVALIRVIHHVSNPDPLLAEVVRVSRNGATFVLGIAHEFGRAQSRKSELKRVTPEGHKIYWTPLGRYSHPGLERVEIRGVGDFDNRVGRSLSRLWPLATIDIQTSRLWPAKPMLFVRYRVVKGSGRNEPRVRCECGGSILEARCDACGRTYGPIIDLVEK
jgi:SAM-dependent methyltransferase